MQRARLGDDAADEADHLADEVDQDQGHHEDKIFGRDRLEEPIMSRC